MLLDCTRPFAGFMPELLLETGRCLYREVYEAIAPDGSKVFLTVYDTARMPKSLSGNIGEFELTRKTQHEMFQTFLDCGEEEVEAGRYRWMATEYYPYRTLREVTEGRVLGEEEVKCLFRGLVQALRELEYLTDGGGHFNLSYENVQVSQNPDGGYVFHLVGLQHAGRCCNGSPAFDVNALNPCFRARETSMGLFQPFTVVYAMAVLLAYSLQGKLPYAICEEDGWARIKTLIQGRKPDLHVRTDLVPVLQKALDSNCRHRYDNVGDFANALRGFLGLEKPAEYAMPATADWGETGKADRKPERKDGKFGLKAVAGMEQLKKTLKRDFVDIVGNIELARRFDITPSNYLFYGPPGTGKTFISMRLAEECGLDSKVISPADLASIYLHGTQGKIKEVFEEAVRKAEANRRGYILIFDEFDAFCPMRTLDNDDKQAGEVAEFLTQLNTCVEKNVFCIGTTNCLDRVDRAVTRHGRIDSVVYIGLPDAGARKELFELELKNRPHEDGINLELLAELTAGYTGSDIAHVVRETARRCFERSIGLADSEVVRIDQALLSETIRDTRPSVTEEEVRRYERMRDEYAGNKVTVRRKIGFKA